MRSMRNVVRSLTIRPSKVDAVNQATAKVGMRENARIQHVDIDAFARVIIGVCAIETLPRIDAIQAPGSSGLGDCVGSDNGVLAKE